MAKEKMKDFKRVYENYVGLVRGRVEKVSEIRKLLLRSEKELMKNVM